MSKKSVQKVLSRNRYPEVEGWDYLEEGALKMSRTASVCMTCAHFRYSSDSNCHALLVCNAHACLIPQGSHVTARCDSWQKNYEDRFAFHSQAA